MSDQHESLIEQARDAARAAANAPAKRFVDYPEDWDDAEIAANAAMRELLKGLKGESVLLRAVGRNDSDADAAAHHILEQFESRCDELLAEIEATATTGSQA